MRHFKIWTYTVTAGLVDCRLALALRSNGVMSERRSCRRDDCPSNRADGLHHAKPKNRVLRT